mgnify:CR=1 FL=1
MGCISGVLARSLTRCGGAARVLQLIWPGPSRQVVEEVGMATKRPASSTKKGGRSAAETFEERRERLRRDALAEAVALVEAGRSAGVSWR